MSFLLDRHWLLTSTFYGNRLPGHTRGYVSRVERDGVPTIHNQIGSPLDHDEPAIESLARERMREQAVRVDASQASAILAQFAETCRYRGWLLVAASVMSDHVHAVVSVPGDPRPGKILGDLKSYAAQSLNRTARRERWWTHRGSKRLLPTEAAVLAAAVYVRDQSGRLAYRSEADWEPFAERHESLPEIGEYAPRLVDD